MAPYSDTDLALLSSGVCNLPWVGQRADLGVGGLRTLVLGESHYTAPKASEDPHGHTRKVIQHWYPTAPHYQLESQSPFFLRITRLLGFSSVTEGFDRISFYNLLNGSVSGREVRPSHSRLVQSRPALFRVLDALHPQILLVAGIKAWDALPGDGEDGWKREHVTESIRPPSRIGQRSPEVWSFAHAGGKCFATFVYHPSAPRFGEVEAWASWMDAALGRAQQLAKTNG